MKKIFAIIGLLVMGGMAATPALYLHHERSTQANVEADCQNREVCLDKTNLAPIGRFNDGTLWHGVTQEKPNVNLTGTLTVTGATVLSNNLTLSLFATGRIPYTTTAGLLTSGTGLTYNGSAFSVTGTGAFSGNTTVGGTLGVTGVISSPRINLNSATDASSFGVNAAGKGIAVSGGEAFYSFGFGVPGATDFESMDMFSNGTKGIIRYNRGGAGTYRSIEIQTSNTAAITVATNQAVTLSSTLGVTGVTTATGGLTLGASFVDKTTSITSNTTLTSAHSVILADATGGSFTITLPTAVGNTGLTYKIFKNDASTNTVSIATTSSQAIGPYASWALVGNAKTGMFEVVSNGTGWNIINALDGGSFTYTEATGVTGSPTATAYWTSSGADGVIIVSFTPVAGTGSTTGFTLTGLPTAIQPASNQVCPIVLTDNGVMISGLASLSAGSGTITLSTTVASGTPVTYNTAGFTASGTKQVGNGTSKATITYSSF